MDGEKRITLAAIVPMRHVSERVPSKNYREFAGRPLYHRIIECLLGCPMISRVVIDTDSPFIAQDAREHFPGVLVLERPPHLCSGTVSMNDVLLNTIRHVPADFYLQTHSTNPLLRSATVCKAIEAFIANYPAYDSLFSVTRVNKRLWDALARPVNHNPSILLRTQDLPPVYEENSSFYIFVGEILGTRHNRVGERPLLFEIDKIEAWDIDESIDFEVAEFFFSLRENA